MEFYSVLVQVWFATTKTELDISHKKLCIGVVSGVAERLKAKDLRKLENPTKLSNLHEDIA